MDYVTRQFIVLAKKLRADFRKSLASLGIDLHHIKDAIQSIDKNTHAYQQKEQSKPEVIAILHEPEGTEAKRHAAHTGTQRRDRVRLFVEWATFFAVIFYGYMAVRQWREQISARHQTQGAIEAAGRSAGAAETANLNFIESNRPWIGRIIPTEPSDSPVWTKGQDEYIRFRYVWVFKNAGKRPANIISVKTTDGFYSGSCGEHPIYDAIPHGHELPPEGKISAARPFVSRRFALPDSIFKSTYGVSVSAHQWSELHKPDPIMVFPKLQYCLYSLIEYVDVAFPNVIHHTQDCTVFAPFVNDYTFIECPDDKYSAAN
jgi:hypothetical protein